MRLRDFSSCRCIRSAPSCFSQASVSRIYVKSGQGKARTVGLTNASGCRYEAYL